MRSVRRRRKIKRSSKSNVIKELEWERLDRRWFSFPTHFLASSNGELRSSKASVLRLSLLHLEHSLRNPTDLTHLFSH